MTYAPKTLSDARAYIVREFGVPANAVGIVGDSAHRGGYHCGRDRTDSDDYSVNESSRDRRGWTNAASALDIGSFNRAGRNLRDFSKWLAAECARGAPDTKDIREVIYSPDGRTVKRWDRLGRRSSGDDSHLWHTHISYHRDAESRDKTAVFRRYIEGDDTMPTPADLAKHQIKHSDTTAKVPYWKGEKSKTWESWERSGAYHAAMNRLETRAEMAAIMAAVAKVAAGSGVTPEQVVEAAREGARAALAEADLEVSWSPGQE